MKASPLAEIALGCSKRERCMAHSGLLSVLGCAALEVEADLGQAGEHRSERGRNGHGAASWSGECVAVEQTCVFARIWKPANTYTDALLANA